MNKTRSQRRSAFRSRLTSGVTLLCLLILALAGAGVYLGGRVVLLRNLDAALYSIARAELASATDGPNGSVHVHDEEALPLHLNSEPGYEKYAQILDARNCVVMQTHNFRNGPPFRMDITRIERARKGESSFADISRGRDIYRAIYYPLRDNKGRALVTMCAIPKQPLQRSLDLLLGILLLVLALSASVAAWGANRLARRMTRPLEDIAVTAQAIEDTNLDQRIQTSSPDAELQDLTGVLNGMLTRLENARTAQQQVIEAQRRFVADASHEMRSPLTNLRGTIEVTLRRPRTEAEYRETLVASMMEIERLSRLTEDLLTLSRADAQQLTLSQTPTDLTLLAQQALQAFRARAEAHQIRLCLDSPEPVQVCGDALRLRQVIDNLLDNGLRYAPGGTALEVGIGRAGDCAVLTVRDHGIGLSLEEQEHIFDRFYRVDRARARSAGGLGLGLAIARTIAEAHGGTLEVQSKPGAGATFLLTLPLASSPPEK